MVIQTGGGRRGGADGRGLGTRCKKVKPSTKEDGGRQRQSRRPGTERGIAVVGLDEQRASVCVAVYACVSDTHTQGEGDQETGIDMCVSKALLLRSPCPADPKQSQRAPIAAAYASCAALGRHALVVFLFLSFLCVAVLDVSSSLLFFSLFLSLFLFPSLFTGAEAAPSCAHSTPAIPYLHLLSAAPAEHCLFHAAARSLAPGSCRRGSGAPLAVVCTPLPVR